MTSFIHTESSQQTKGWLPSCVDYIKRTASGGSVTRRGCYRTDYGVGFSYTNQVFLVDDPTGHGQYLFRFRTI
ncbi:hypothetical protein RB213_000822 [Colletotrichum asianum]